MPGAFLGKYETTCQYLRDLRFRLSNWEEKLTAKAREDTRRKKMSGTGGKGQQF